MATLWANDRLPVAIRPVSSQIELSNSFWPLENKQLTILILKTSEKAPDFWFEIFSKDS